MDDQIRYTERDLYEMIGRLNVANQMLQQRLAAALAENAGLRQRLAALTEQGLELSQLGTRVGVLMAERDDLQQRLAVLSAAIEASRKPSNGHEPAADDFRAIANDPAEKLPGSFV